MAVKHMKSASACSIAPWQAAGEGAEISGETLLSPRFLPTPVSNVVVSSHEGAYTIYSQIHIEIRALPYTRVYMRIWVTDLGAPTYCVNLYLARKASAILNARRARHEHSTRLQPHTTVCYRRISWGVLMLFHWLRFGLVHPHVDTLLACDRREEIVELPEGTGSERVHRKGHAGRV